MVSLKSIVWLLAGVVGAVLQLLLISVLLRGLYKKYPVLFLYVVVSFLMNVAESAEYWKLIQWSSFGVQLYWINEMIFQVLVFSTVISLIHRASAGLAARRSRTLLLVAGAALVMGLSIALPYTDVSLNRWMTEATRNLSFASAVLNVLLWTRLLAQKQRDAELLMISGAFGVQTAGKAIGHSLRGLEIYNLGTPLVPITYLLSLLLLWLALRRRAPALARQVP